MILFYTLIQTLTQSLHLPN